MGETVSVAGLTLQFAAVQGSAPGLRPRSQGLALS